MKARALLGFVAAAAVGLLCAVAARADDVPTCNEQDFIDTLQKTSDGTVTFFEDCNLTLSGPITIGANTVLVIDAQDNAVTINGGGKGPIFILQTNVSLFISGITFSGGVNSNGGAFYIDKRCQVTLTNCTFSGNTALGSNGTAGVNGIDTQSTYGNGQSGGNGYAGTNGLGGAIYNLGRLTLLNCALTGNSAIGGAGGNGGDGGRGYTNFSGYRGGNGGNGGPGGGAYGGAIFSQGTLFLNNCVISSNLAVAGAGGAGGTNGAGYAASYAGSGAAGGMACGAGIYSLKNFTVVNCTFFSNSATAGASASAGSASGEGPEGPGGAHCLGGAVYTAGGALTNCTFVLNTATAGAGGAGGTGVGAINAGGKGGYGGNGTGGGLYNTGTVAVVHCTFSACGAVGGAAGAGGAGAPAGASGNAGLSRGGAIANGYGKFLLMNSILSTNGPGRNAYGTISDLGYNISSDGTPSKGSVFTRTNLDPQIKTLAANGGPTNLSGAMLTIALAAASSPAYGVIQTNSTNFVITYDQRSAPRPGGTKRGCDIGAYEIGPPFILDKANPLQYQYPSYGGSVTFQVSAVGDSPISYYWSYNGTPQASDNTSTFTVSGVTNENRGITNLGGYQVIVSNVFGVLTSAPVIVHFIPSAVIPPTNQIVLAGGSLTNSVSVLGDTNSTYSYQWRLSSTNLPGTNAFTFHSPSTNNSFILQNVTTNDAGKYDVVVSNDFGSVTSTVATVIVDQITTQPASQTVATNTRVTFSVGVVGSSSLTYLVVL